eukprot:10060-Heterococcus_DN1.PRE.2
MQILRTTTLGCRSDASNSSSGSSSGSSSSNSSSSSSSSSSSGRSSGQPATVAGAAMLLQGSYLSYTVVCTAAALVVI